MIYTASSFFIVLSKMLLQQQQIGMNQQIGGPSQGQMAQRSVQMSTQSSVMQSSYQQQIVQPGSSFKY